jgi:hypothetical protein
MTSPQASDTVYERPEPGDTYFLAIGSFRVRGHRFTWGQALPDAEGKTAYDNGFAVRGRDNLRDDNGNRLPHPAFLAERDGNRPDGTLDTGDRVPSTGDTVEVSGPDGMTREGATGVNDSQSGTRTSRRSGQK